MDGRLKITLENIQLQVRLLVVEGIAYPAPFSLRHNKSIVSRN